jgi:predicted exporter
MRKNLNLIVFLIITFSLFFYVLKNNENISFDLLSIFPSDYPEVTRLNVYQKFENSQKLFFELSNIKNSQVKNLKKELNNIYGITKVISNIKDFSSKELNDFFIKSHIFRSKINLPDKITKHWIDEKLLTLKNTIYTSPFLLSSDFIKKDPLNIFIEKKPDLPSLMKIIKKDGSLASDNGLIILANTNINISDIAKSTIMVDQIKSLIKKYDDLEIKFFAPHRYSVENSRILKQIITIMMIFISLAIFIFYYKVVKNVKLLLSTYAIIAFSIFLSFAIITKFYSTLSIFTLAFSTTILGLAIDYSIHYYVTGYTHKSPFKINKDIFLAYFTSAFGLILLSFADFPLLKQIGIFCAMGLTFSFIGITYLLPLLGDFNYDDKNNFFNDKKLKRNVFKYILVLSILLIIIILPKMHIDSNLRHLDYNNKTTHLLEKYFTKIISSDKKVCLISADNKEALLEKTEVIKQKLKNKKIFSVFITDFLPSQKKQQEIINKIKSIDWDFIKNNLITESQKIGFKKDYFKDTYNFKDLKPIENYDILKEINMQIVEYKNKFYTLGMVDKAVKLDKNMFFLNSQTILSNMQLSLFKQFYVLISISILFIILMLTLAYKNLSKIITSLSFILAPIAISLLIMKIFNINLNILHLFSFLMILIAGIDYGIYYNVEEKFKNIRFAVFVSAVTTLINFIPFLFTNTGALVSTAIPIVAGIITILILSLLRPKRSV